MKKGNNDAIRRSLLDGSQQRVPNQFRTMTDAKQRKRDRWSGKLYAPLSEAFSKVGRAEQLIRNWLPATGVSFILAQFSVGKTLLLLDQALCLATDRDWMGFPTIRGRTAVYLCGEDPEGALSNAEAWCKLNDVAANSEDTRILFVPMTPDLLDRKDCELLVKRVREALPHGSRPVIFIDTWQRSTASGGQNEDKDMQLAIANAEFIGKELGGPVIAASHPPKNNSGTISGSGVIQNSSVAIWDMRRTKEKDRRSLTVTRIKGAGHGTEISLRIGSVQIEGKDNYGCARTGAVIAKDGVKQVGTTVTEKAGHSILDPSEAELLLYMERKPGESFAKMAVGLNWHGEEGKPNTSRVKNKMQKLSMRQLVYKDISDAYSLTPEGRKRAEQLKSTER